MAETSRFVVSPEWLAERLGREDVAIVDASWYLPQQGRDGRAEYLAEHIPGAVYFDLDAVSDPASGLPHMLAAPEEFAHAAGRMGISENDTIVVYDGMGLFSAPRVWWNFRVMGAPETYLLDGGLAAWKDKGLPLTDAPSRPPEKTFRPSFDPACVRGLEAVRAAVADGSEQIVDARSYGRFTGDEPEPREGMRSGHMPGALSLPFAELLDDGRLKDIDALRELFRAAGVDLERPVVTTCGSGVTAATISLALMSIGHDDNAVYDGSWTEWGGRQDTPIDTGPASKP